MAEISGLWVYPIKSCRGIALDAAQLTRDGLARDRHWMLVDHDGRFLSQRQHPRMALIDTALGDDTLRVAADGMPALELPFEHEGQRVAATVWRDTCAAIDAGDAAAAWFSDVLGMHCRLVAFDAREPRLSDPAYAGDSGATTQFSDGFALLVIGDASLVALNERLAAKDVAPVAMTRFRPNLTVRGLDAFDEDHLSELRTASGVLLRLVKPCARCQVTTIDPLTGERDAHGEPLATLNGFRVKREHGTLFGQNAIVLDVGAGRIARGEELALEWNF